MQIPSEYRDAAVTACLKAAEILRKWSHREPDISYKEDNSPVTLADRESHEAIHAILKETGLPVLSEEGKLNDYEVRKHWNLFWMVDPLDGTKEFIAGRNEYTINIALIQKDSPIFGLIGVPEQHKVYMGISGVASYLFEESQLLEGCEDAKGQQLPMLDQSSGYRVVASRSHLSKATSEYIDGLRNEHPQLSFVQAGSALKFCRLAEGSADIYPRFTPCMEWDTAAGHAILLGVGKNVIQVGSTSPLKYNKKDLLSPFFIAK